jgi:outer membrane lipoprotein-sorting protein
VKGSSRCQRNGSGWPAWAWAWSVLAACAWSGVAARAQEEKLPSGEQLMEKSIEARGGQAAFDKLKTRVSKGKIELAGGGSTHEGTVTLYEAAPNKRYLAVELEVTGKIQSGSDGQVCWELSGPGGATVYEGEEKAQRQRESTFNALAHWKELYQKAECVGKEQIDDHSCYKVVLTPTLGKPETIYFDRKTLFPARMDTIRKVKNPMAGEMELQLQVTQDDYKQVDGVWLPFKLTRRVTVAGEPQTVQTITYTWQSIEQNVDIPATRFEPPPQIRDLPAGKATSRPALGKPGG